MSSLRFKAKIPPFRAPSCEYFDDAIHTPIVISHFTLPQSTLNLIVTLLLFNAIQMVLRRIDELARLESGGAAVRPDLTRPI